MLAKEERNETLALELTYRMGEDFAGDPSRIYLQTVRISNAGTSECIR